MRIALIGDFDTFVVRGLERPLHLLPYRLSPGFNLLRGLREINAGEIHVLVVTPEVDRPIVEPGPLGILHRLPCPRGSGSPSLFLWRRALLLRELRKIDPDIVHGQGSEGEYAFTAVTSPYPNVITFHGIMHRVHEINPPPLFSLSHVPRWVEKIVARKARHVISISQEVETFLHNRHSPARTYRLPNAMAPCFFEVQPKPDPASHTVLYVGAIQRRKGLIHLVEALAAAQPRLDRPVRLLVIGPEAKGPEQAYAALVRSRAQELGVSNRIEWLGVLRESDVAATLARSDMLVLPSFWENMPMCIGEAMSAGVAVISTTAAGIPDWVEDGRTGLLVPPGDSPALAQALFSLLSNGELRAQLAAAGRAKARAQYAPSVVAEKTLRVYEEICRQQE